MTGLHHKIKAALARCAVATALAMLAALTACGTPAVPQAAGAESAPTPTVAATPAPTPEMTQTAETAEPTQPTTQEETMIYAHIGQTTLTIALADNSSATAFADLLAKGDVTINMRDYANFEKVGPIGTSLPTNDEQITTVPGDVILYMGNQITIYYDTNSWNFTRLGKVQGLSQQELKAALGTGDVTVVFSLQ